MRTFSHKILLREMKMLTQAEANQRPIRSLQPSKIRGGGPIRLGGVLSGQGLNILPSVRKLGKKNIIEKRKGGMAPPRCQQSRTSFRRSGGEKEECLWRTVLYQKKRGFFGRKEKSSGLSTFGKREIGWTIRGGEGWVNTGGKIVFCKAPPEEVTRGGERVDTPQPPEKNHRSGEENSLPGGCKIRTECKHRR